MRGGLLLFFVMVLGCTARNPEYCGDGTCIDPSRPYCDVDGSFSGTPGTCIAVECTPNEHISCRGDIALTCSTSGKNYDSVQCQLGCDPDALGCKACTANAQCMDAAPICDAVTSHCRQCTADDECDSRVCDFATGSCVPESKVVYASASAISGSCSLSQPCSLQKAYVAAANATPIPTIRMLPGNYTASLRADVPTATPVRLVGTGANMVVVGADAAIVVEVVQHFTYET